MNTSTNNKSGNRRGLSKVQVIVAAVVLLAGAAAGYYYWQRESGPEKLYETVDVRRGPLTISVTEEGSISNKEKVVLKSEVPGSNVITFIVPEGKQVEEGQLLVELSSSKLEDELDQQEITVLKADAALIAARENLAVTESQTRSDLSQAKLDVQFAEQDLNKYINGDYPQELEQARAEITIAEEDLNRAQDKLEWSEKLAAEGYITEQELEADRLARDRAQLDLKLAKGKLQLLEEYTYQRQVAELEAGVEQARLALDRVERKAKSDVIQAEADLKAKQLELERQQETFADIKERLTNCRITAPVAGEVVYATTGRFSWRGETETLEVGTQVQEREELIYIPTAKSMSTEIKIHESSLQKVRVGMPARVSIDALEGKFYEGRVEKISPYPDQTSVFLNPDLKVYSTEVSILGDTSELRAGMTCKVEIVVQEYEDALFVPVQCVVRKAGEPLVYVDTPDGPRERRVEIGMDNNSKIHILSGLEEGEEVLLNPPLSGEVTAVRTGAIPDRGGQTPPGETPPNVSQTEIDFSKVRDMTPEQRTKWYESLSDEQKQQLRKSMQQMRGRGGAQRGSGASQTGNGGNGPRP